MPFGIRIDTSLLLHQDVAAHWQGVHAKHENAQAQLPTRAELCIRQSYGLGKQKLNGDQVVENVKDIFYNKLGIEWSDLQSRIFEKLHLRFSPFQ